MKSKGNGLGDNPLVKQLMGTSGKKGKGALGPNQGNSGIGELRIEELDEVALKKRLENLEKDLTEYKKKCIHYKTENEWYRNEIETTQRDTAEYISYLTQKRSEKQSSIDKLVELQKRDLQTFQERLTIKEAENAAKIEELKALTTELEVKLEGKQQDIMHLSDIMSKRTRHESEMLRIRKEMAESDAKHAIAVSELERSLLEIRMKLQREADLKIQDMENAAQAKAAKYLSDHTMALEAENQRLEKELRKCIMVTQEYIARKDALEKENRELLREQKVREDLLKLRIDRVITAEVKEKKLRQAKKEKQALTKMKIVADGISKRGGKLDEGLELALEMSGKLKGHPLKNTVPTRSEVTSAGYSLKSGGTSRLPSRGKPVNASERQFQRVVVMAGPAQAPQETIGAVREETGPPRAELAWSDSDESDDEYI